MAVKTLCGLAREINQRYNIVAGIVRYQNMPIVPEECEFCIKPCESCDIAEENDSLRYELTELRAQLRKVKRELRGYKGIKFDK
jgi:hypothetical protein